MVQVHRHAAPSVPCESVLATRAGPWSVRVLPLLLAVPVMVAGCGVTAGGTAGSRPTATPTEASSASRALATASSYMKELKAGDYSAQWALLAPLAREQWPSEGARAAMLRAKFQGAAKIVSFTLGEVAPAPTWVSPENPSQAVAGGAEIPVAVTFSAPEQLQPSGVALDFAHERLVLVPAPRGGFRILGEGPASLDAPLIKPAVEPQESASVPVLMYHVVAPFPIASQWNSPYAYQLEYGLTVTPAQFAGQMEYLNSVDAHAISLNRLADFLFYGLPLPPHPVVITFDDGRESPYQNALPVLARYGYTATFFVPTGLVGKFVHAKGGTNPQHYLSWAQVQELAATGFWVEDHTLYDNLALWGQPASLVATLAGQTASTLAEHTGRPVQFIAYSGLWPYPSSSGVGPSQQALFSELGNLGYVGGVVDARVDSDLQTTSQIWQIPRVRMNPNEAGSGLSPWFS